MHGKNKISEYSIENIKTVSTDSKAFKLFSFEYFAKDIDHLMLVHRHNFYTIIYVTSGSGSHVVDFIKYEIVPQRVFLINYGQLHHWTSLNNIKGYVILFTQDFYNLIFSGNDKIRSDTVLMYNVPFIDLKEFELKEWILLMQLLEEECKKNSLHNKEVICLLLKVLVLKYNRIGLLKESHLIINNRKSQIVMEYKKSIDQYYKDWKLPKYYAQLLHITPNYLNSACNEVLGKSASDIIKDRVILEAKRLLSHTDSTATEISYELGFDDNSHFGKYFKTAVSITPEQFRNQFNDKK